MIENNLTSYRQEEYKGEATESVIQERRLFEKQVGNVILLKCTVQQNRQDGIKSVDYAV